ncbi:hypothetical protein RDWZM_006708 [Blomia tropicalis]|uniref:Uncharacterized protein n=1 Tax=Blomia tropicalis TaxID=40697 RepID=A0A9Q0RNN1_BLOTA|nr:hypothetical protein RDWZM_006708 [Blomia tropicalis]
MMPMQMMRMMNKPQPQGESSKYKSTNFPTSNNMMMGTRQYGSNEKSIMMQMKNPMQIQMQNVQDQNQVQQQQQQQEQYESMQPVKAAIQTTHTIDYKEVPNEQSNIMPQTILVEANNIPLKILFQSKSSDLNIQSEHIPSPPVEPQETESEDEPHRLIHRVTKPIVQQIYELIMPYRKIIQQIEPVKEEIQTIVSRSVASDNKYEPVNNKNGNGNGGGYGSSMSMGEQMGQPMRMSMNEPLMMPKYSPTDLTDIMRSLNMDMAPKKSYSMPMTMSYEPVQRQQQQSPQQQQQQQPKQSRMQMYLSQMTEQQQQQSMNKVEQTMEPQERESIMKSMGDTKVMVNSIPMMEMSEPEHTKQEEIQSTELSIGEEKDVTVPSMDETSTPSSANLRAEREKMMQSLMYYGAGISLTGGSGAPKLSSFSIESDKPPTYQSQQSSRNFMQTTNYGSSPNEPSGY